MDSSWTVLARWCAMGRAVIKSCLPINLCIHGALLVVPQLHSVFALSRRVDQTMQGRKHIDFGSIAFTDNKSGSVKEGPGSVLCVQTAVIEGSTEGL